MYSIIYISIPKTKSERKTFRVSSRFHVFAPWNMKSENTRKRKRKMALTGHHSRRITHRVPSTSCVVSNPIGRMDVLYHDWTMLVYINISVSLIFKVTANRDFFSIATVNKATTWPNRLSGPPTGCLAILLLSNMYNDIYI